MILWLGLLVLLSMTAWYLVALARRDNSLADIAWGIGFILIALLATLLAGPSVPGLVATALVTIWGLRLSWHIARRHRGEDPRYAQWRKEWTWVKTRAFFQVWMLQGLLMLLVSAPVIHVIMARPAPSLWTVIGALVWAVGFFIETVADAQVRRWKRRGGSGLYTDGLWRYSRHPNYFGEALLWWGIWLIALGAPGGWMTIYGPLSITFLLRFVSGVPLTERRYAGREGWDAYKRRTNAFVPWFPKQ